MTVKTQCLSVLVIELYLCVGGGLFYWLEFSDVTIQNDKSNQESNFSQILKEFSQYKGKLLHYIYSLKKKKFVCVMPNLHRLC